MLTLYDVEVENTEGIDGFTSTEIFSTGGSDEVWGMKGKDEFCNPLKAEIIFLQKDGGFLFSLEWRY